MSRHLVLSILGLFGLFALRSDTAGAQWAQVYKFGYPINCVKFLGGIGLPAVGFVSAGTFVYRTSDGGKTWSPVLKVNGSASAFEFRDGLDGWLAVNGPTATIASYKTVDGGRSWQPLPPQGEGDDIYYNQTSGVLLLSLRGGGTSGGGQVLVSRDDGSTWTSFGIGMNGFAFASGSLGISSTITAPFAVTSDGGQTWQAGSSGFHCWAPTRAPGTSYIGAGDQSRSIFRSDDGGVTWVPTGTVSSALTGCAQATGCSVYVQGSLGIYVSTDLTTWKQMSGSPGNDFDTRFCVSGNDIYAGDQAGNVMHAVSSVTLWPTLRYDEVQRSVTLPAGCPVDTLRELFRNLTCSGVTVLSVSLTDSTNMRLIPLALPLVVAPADTFQFRVIMSPRTGGSFSSTVHIKLQNSTGTSDTTLVLTIDASHFSAPIVDSLHMTVVQCGTRDTLLHIKNTHCDSLSLTAIQLLDSTDAAVGNITLPITLRADSSIAIPLSIAARASGSFIDRVRLVFTYGSITLDTIVRMQITVKDAVPSATLSDKVVDFGTVSMCQSAQQMLTITNTTCDSVLVTELMFNADPAMSMAPMSLPRWLKSGESLSLAFTLQPQSVSTPSGTIDIMLKNGAVEKIFSAVLQANVVAARHGVSMMPASMTVDSLPPCSTFDTVLVLRNLSACDSMTIAQVAASDPSLGVTTDPGLPCVIRAADSLVVRIHASSPSTVDAGVRITGPTFDSTVAVHLSFRADVAEHLTLAASGLTDFVLHRCDLDSADFTIGALGCNAVDVSSISITGDPTGPFSLSDGSGFTLGSGSTRSVRVYASGGEAGSHSAQLIVTSRSGETRSITLTATILPVDTTGLAVRLQAGANAAPKENETTTSEVYFAKPVATSSALSDVQFDLEFDRDVIGETSLTPAAGWSLTTRSATASKLTLELTRTNITPISAGDVLLTTQHRATISNTLAVSIRLTNLVMNPTVSRYAECTLAASVDTSAIAIPLGYTCGDSTISRFVANLPLLSDLTARPNPANASVTLAFSVRKRCSCTCSVIDVRGRVRTVFASTAAAGSNEIPLDLHGVEPGEYLAVVESEGVRRSVPIVVVR